MIHVAMLVLIFVFICFFNFILFCGLILMLSAGVESARQRELQVKPVPEKGSGPSNTIVKPKILASS